VLLLAAPLSQNRVEFIQQVELENVARNTLINNTLTFQKASLLESEFDWRTTPPEVRLVLMSEDSMTPKQVQLLEELIIQEVQQPISLKLRVIPFEDVDY